jgi:RimJ/RimL family protein N-acetyltransferase
MKQPTNPILTNNQIHKIFEFADRYIILRDRDDEIGMAAWRERVRETFPDDPEYMLEKIREVAEQKERERVSA